MRISKKFSKFWQYFNKGQTSAAIAKERLQIIIAHERAVKNQPDYLPLLQKDLIAVIAKYVPIDTKDIKIDIDKQHGCSVLELNIFLPETV